MMWFETALRWLFVFIDRVVYWAVDKVYGLFIMISETGLFTQDAISTIASRIYVLLGVFMLFKVSFSLISYVLNPDAMTDKSKGVGNLVKRIIIVLIGIIAIPYVFQAAYGLQNIILKDNIIGNIILGDVASSEFQADNDNYIDYGGRLMAHTTLSAFLKLNPAVVGEECANNPVGVNGVFNDSACDFAALEDQINGSMTVREVLIYAHTYKDTSVYFDPDLILLKAENEYGEEDWLFDYSPILSTLCGGFLAWILLIFCIDIATRSVKLGFLQLVAPIPVISYVDPKGEKIFQKWLGECGKTYADVFVRLIAIYFVIYVVATLELNGMHNVVDPSIKVDNIFVKIFIIFGALMFAKQLPDLISNILGIKLGGFTLNPMKKLGQSPYAAGLVGAVGGAVGGAYANLRAARKEGLGFWKGAGSVIAGATSAGSRGLITGLKSDGKSSALDSAKKSIQASNQARYNRDVNQKANYSFWQRRSDDLDKFAGVKNKDAGVGMYDKEMKALKRKMDDYQGQEHALRDAMANFIATSNFSFKDFDTNSLYVGGQRNADATGNYNYVSWTDYVNAGGALDQTTFDKFKSFQEGIDHYDSEYEKLRKQYGQYEDAYKARNKDSK